MCTANGSIENRVQLTLVSLVVFALCFASFELNLFRAADQTLFDAFDVYSDNWVLDPLRIGAQTLGHFRNGEFAQYRSQYGLHIWFFNLFGGLERFSTGELGTISAVILAAVIALTTWLVGRRIFCNRGTLAFGLFIALSPSTVVIASSVYWMAWTWYLPLIVSLGFGNKVFSGGGLLVASICWFVALSVKNVFGYEFSSSVALAAAAPIVFLGLQARLSLVRTLVPCFVLGSLSVLSLVSVLILHASYLSDGGNLSSGWGVLKTTISKRTAGLETTQADFAASCAATPDFALLKGVERESWKLQCVSDLIRSKSAPIPIVLATYSTFRRTIPYLGGPDIIDHPTLTPMRRAIRSLNFADVLRKLEDLDGQVIFPLLSLPATMLVVWSGIVFASLRIFRRRDLHLPVFWMLIVAVLAPISWYVLAKGHSYGHTHINFVLWNLPFLPLLAGFIFTTEPICESRRQNDH